MSNHKQNGWDGKIGIDPSECVVDTIEGQALVFPSVETNEAGCDYIRFIRTSDQRELLYWIASEWAEAPEEVMGAIMGAILKGANDVD